MRTKASAALIVAAAAPAVVLAGVEAAVLAVALFREHPRWPDTRLNLAEATAVRENAEVIRLLERGDDPNARLDVRPGLLGNEVPIAATPLEAAVSIRRTDLISLLLDHGAVLTPEDWLRLRCVAGTQGYDDVVATLDEYQRSTPAPACSGDERLW